MALPLNPNSPADASSPGLGDDEIRALKQWIVDVWGVPVFPAAITAPVGSINTGGVVTFTTPPVGLGIRSAKVTRSSTQTISDNIVTAVQWNSEAFDSANFHDNVVNNHLLQAPFTGIYLLSASTIWPNTAGGSRFIGIVQNGGSMIAAARTGVAIGSDEQNVTTITQNNAGGDFEVQVFQNSGGDLALGASDLNRLSFSLVFLGAAF